MIDQIISLIKALQKRITELDRKYDFPLVINNEKIQENNNCIIDIADLIDENSVAIEELAEIISDLDERVRALEGE